ncbi:MAG TPA: choice-of-anchor P family protein [Streptosporangiaceae bacterium]|jgi:hypothetical protein|nr:choice-of-anchor P family protein [Streptosporangiaceae bacterium]
MKRFIAAAAAAASSLALAGVATALPASAATQHSSYRPAVARLRLGPAIMPYSYGARANGPVFLDRVALARPGASPTLASNANASTLLTTGVVKDTATTTTATSKVASVVVNLTSLSKLTADNVTSACFRGFFGGLVGDTDISGGKVVTTGGVPSPTTIALPATPAPNTVITVPGIATITLNRQILHLDGRFTVNAMYIKLMNSTQNLTIGTSSCVAPVAVTAPTGIK